MRRVVPVIAGLLVIVLLRAVGLAPVRERHILLRERVISSLTLAALLVSILPAVHRTGSSWAFWLGFALLGWTYLGLSMVPSAESRLLTTFLGGELSLYLEVRRSGPRRMAGASRRQ